MQLNVTGHHVEVTESMRGYVEKKLERIGRHYDQVLDVHCILTVEKLRQKAEATLHGRADLVRRERPEHERVHGDQHKLHRPGQVLENYAGCEKRPMYALGDIMGGAAPGARINSDGRRHLVACSADAAVEFRVPHDCLGFI